MAKFEIFKDKKGEFRFRLIANNGRIITGGEGYKHKAGARNAIRLLRSPSVMYAPTFDLTLKSKVTIVPPKKPKKLVKKLPKPHINMDGPRFYGPRFYGVD